ncbi:hypothetical protein [Haloarcula laminariae]|uniref:hypothetical protein n=1 Tax=Haloarcula laminariae TaxID=2961577 RepID=UPI0024063DC7|nr:hypothetical protein [Halomicroarcula sp. FL173]
MKLKLLDPSSKMNKTNLANSREELLGVLQSVRAAEEGPKDSMQIGGIYGDLKNVLENVDDRLNSGDPDKAIQAAEHLTSLSIHLLTIVMSDSGINEEIDTTHSIYFALGSYMEQEGKKRDQWTEETYTEIYQHTSHEIGEIRRNINSNDLDFLLHNSVDMVLLSAILTASLKREYC